MSERHEGAIRDARTSDVAALVALHREFCAEDGQGFDAATAGRALAALVGGDPFGRVYVISSDTDLVGYAALTFGYSIEFGGRDAFLDEIYVQPAHRGDGRGLALLAHAARIAGRLDVRAVHLEVHRRNESARRLYASLGFEDRSRYALMSLRLPAGETR